MAEKNAVRLDDSARAGRSATDVGIPVAGVSINGMDDVVIGVAVLIVGNHHAMSSTKAP